MAWTYQAQVDLSDQWVNRATGEVSNVEPSERNAVAAWNTWQAYGGDPASLLPSWVAEYLPRAAYQPDRQGWFDFEFGGKRYRLNQGNPWIAETSNSGWLVYLRDPYFTGYNSAEVVYVADLPARLKEANAGGLFDYMPTIILAAAGAGLTGMLPGTTNVFSGSGLVSGSLDPSGASALSDTEQITVSLSETGATNMGETGLEWYNVNPGPDPFATTDAVNAGWTYENGYGVDWYNAAGVGEVANSNSLDSILSAVNKVSATASRVIGTASALFGTAQAATRPAPNLQRSAGSISLPLILGAVLAVKFL